MDAISDHNAEWWTIAIDKIANCIALNLKQRWNYQTRHWILNSIEVGWNKLSAVRD
jgi:hypothetical protein